MNALRTERDVELLEPAANRLVLDADFPGNVAGRAFAGEVLLAEPVFVDGGGAAGSVNGDVVSLGMFEYEVAGESGRAGDLGERLAAFGVFAVQEVAGEDPAGSFAQAPGGQRRGFACPDLRFGGDVFQCESDVGEGGVQFSGSLAGRSLFGDDDAVDGAEVDVMGVASERSGRSGSNPGRGSPAAAASVCPAR
ncbi:hypothetical protein ACFTY8_32570 [Streptomyces mirabilis]|uniref:hypothetical protein n=1 Tax=Streptomyces mirabilis TaxID=68239 RepID=UPI00362EE743